MSDDINMPSPDTEVTLLLCGFFGETSISEFKPLTPSEYSRISGWLLNSGHSPTDLERPETREQIPDSVMTGMGRDRLVALLERRAELEVAVKKWQEQGIWVLSRTDIAYPNRLLDRLQKSAPPLLFGIGKQALLNEGGLAMVGSRNADADALAFARQIAAECADAGMQVVSGGARGIDREAMSAVLDAGGNTLGVLADSLSREATSGRHDLFLEQRRLTLVSPYHPDAGFSVGNAMGRNKCIYSLADWSLVVAAAAAEGGTWAGAVENLKHHWTPLLVRDGEDVPDGNRRLLKMGGTSFPDRPGDGHTLLETLDSALAPGGDSDSKQTDLFTAPDAP